MISDLSDEVTDSMDTADHNTFDKLENAPVLHQVLGDAFEPLKVFHEKISEEGLRRGIIGPRDVDIIWERHILNSAAIVPFVDQACIQVGSNKVADVGSGGGFPGIVLAACLPELQFTLIEPMERRVEWLQETVAEVGLHNVKVIRSRSEDLVRGKTQNLHKQGRAGRNGARPAYHKKQQQNPKLQQDYYDNYFAVVTCRAVAPLTKLAAWTLPLVQSGGQLVALKGRSAQVEIDKADKELRKYGGRNPRVLEAPVGNGLESTHVVLVDKL